jgi:hypothetical protein
MKQVRFEVKQNFFPTLDESMRSESLYTWFKHAFPNGIELKAGCSIDLSDHLQVIKVYRASSGMYERPITYMK